jgi:hypothetical protein
MNWELHVEDTQRNLPVFLGMIWRKSLSSALAAVSSQQQGGFPKETEPSFINLADKM